jgi:hypothetical protein
MAAQQLPAEHLMPCPFPKARLPREEMRLWRPGTLGPMICRKLWVMKGGLPGCGMVVFPRRFCSSVVTSLSGARRLLETLARRMFTPKNVLKP